MDCKYTVVEMTAFWDGGELATQHHGLFDVCGDQIPRAGDVLEHGKCWYVVMFIYWKCTPTNPKDLSAEFTSVEIYVQEIDYDVIADSIRNRKRLF